MFSSIKILTLLFIFSTLANAENNTTETCTLVSSTGIDSVDFGYVGDTSGKRVFTKKLYTYDCVSSSVGQGACKVWGDEDFVYDLNSTKKSDVYFETDDYSGSMGATLSLIQGYSKLDGLWSGWHGVCQKGKDDGNWDWLSDPYVIGSYAMTAYGASSSDAANAEDATKAAKYTNKVVQTSICAARAGIDISKAVEEYEDDGVPCDPIDEFCDEEDNGDSGTFTATIPENKYNDLITGTPEASDYIHVVSGQGSGYVKIKISSPSQDNSYKNEEDAKKAKEEAQKIKKMLLGIKAILITIQTATCVSSATTGGGTSGGTTDNGDALSGQNLTVMAVSQINPLVGMGVSIAANVYGSMQEIDTCNNKDDAKKKGSRHIATLYAKKNGMCHFINKKESGNLFSEKKIYNYCCYDNAMTRVLVEQAKAQLAKNWSSCTDITIKELGKLKLNECSALDRQNGVDGVQMPYLASTEDRMEAYQYKSHCIDTKEYIDKMMEMFGGNNMLIDESAIQETLEDLQ